MTPQKRPRPAEEESPDPAREQRAAIDKAMTYLTARDYASGELYEKLCQRFSARAAAAAVAEMHERAYLDDARFARSRARYLGEVKHKSPREIRQALRAKGISDEDITSALDALEDYDETQTCRVLIEKQYLRKLSAGREDLVIAALMRRGFSYGVVREALDEVADAE